MTDPDTQRIFIGVPVDGQAQNHIDRLLKQLIQMHPRLRWVPECNRHLTLAFLGDVPVSLVHQLMGLFDETYGQEASFQFPLTRLAPFPKPNSGIIALTGEVDRSLEKLFRITARSLRGIGQEVDTREFLPHVTLVRLGRRKHASLRLEQAVEVVLNAAQVRLYRSTLTESGPIYSVLKETTFVR
jgi:2'-5' RNA ligase